MGRVQACFFFFFIIYLCFFFVFLICKIIILIIMLEGMGVCFFVCWCSRCFFFKKAMVLKMLFLSKSMSLEVF